MNSCTSKIFNPPTHPVFLGDFCTFQEFLAPYITIVRMTGFESLVFCGRL